MAEWARKFTWFDDISEVNQLARELPACEAQVEDYSRAYLIFAACAFFVILLFMPVILTALVIALPISFITDEELDEVMMFIMKWTGVSWLVRAIMHPARKMLNAHTTRVNMVAHVARRSKENGGITSGEYTNG